jgi:hypothetical protein
MHLGGEPHPQHPVRMELAQLQGFLTEQDEQVVHHVLLMMFGDDICDGKDHFLEPNIRIQEEFAGISL